MLKEISAAEYLFRDKLELFLNGIFSNTTIDSHGPAHHRRVWVHAKDLLLYREIGSSVKESSFPVKLLIGSYLHDSGMVKETGPRHGIESRIFCEQFLAGNGLNPKDYADLLDAVENHDNKDYLSTGDRTLLYDILTVADDLDALGYTGIYRYLEIYLIRGISINEAGTQILTNIRGRFANLERTFSHVPSLASRFRPRLEIITGFFEKCNMQSKVYRFGAGNPSGYCGVAEIIDSMIRNNSGLNEVIEASIESPDRVISWYFGELKRELS